MGKILESKVQRDSIKWLRAQPEVYVYRAMGNAMAAKGTPDILCCIAGRFVAIEFKREHDGAYGVTEPQRIRLRQIERAGGYGFVLTSLLEVQYAYDKVWRDTHPTA